MVGYIIYHNFNQDSHWNLLIGFYFSNFGEKVLQNFISSFSNKIFQKLQCKFSITESQLLALERLKKQFDLKNFNLTNKNN